MVPSLSGFGLFLLLYAALFWIALIAHLVWLWRTATTIWHWQKPLIWRLAAILLAAITPVISFYASLIIRYASDPLGRSGKISPLTFVMPAVASCVMLWVAIAEDSRYIKEDRSWSNVADFLSDIFAFYIVTQLVFYMAARVFGLSKNGPLATRVHLVTCTILLLTSIR